MGHPIEALPVTDHPTLLKLLALRTDHRAYVGVQPSGSAILGTGFAKAVIPDAALEHLTPKDIFDYRRKSSDIYDAWTIELNAMAAKVDDLDPAEAAERIPRMIASELEPRILAYRNEMISIRDNMFRDMLKNITDVKVPALSFGAMHLLGFEAAVAAAATASGIVAKPAVDALAARRAAKRKHPVSYLIGARNLSYP